MHILCTCQKESKIIERRYGSNVAECCVSRQAIPPKSKISITEKSPNVRFRQMQKSLPVLFSKITTSVVLLQSSSRFFPLGKYSPDFFLHLFPGIPSLIASGQKPIVFCLGMSDMGRNGQVHRFLVKALPCRRATDPAAVFETGMLGYRCLFSGRASGKKLPAD